MAGCATALTAARHGIPVTILHAGSDRTDCNSYWAQGGVIYRNYRLFKKNQHQQGQHQSNGDSSYKVVSHSNHSRKGDDNNNQELFLADTPLSLVNDIRVASGYQGPLLQSRGATLEEGTYSSYMAVHKGINGGGASFSIDSSASSSSSSTGGGSNNNNKSSCASNHQHHPTKLGHRCPTSGVHWNEDAAWKLALEGPSRVRQLLLGKQDDGRGDEYYGCVVPFDRTTSVPVPATTPSTTTANANNADNNSANGNHNKNDVLSLCLEASHAVPRIIHHADCTGKVITTCITQAAYNHPLINFVGDAVVTDLILNEEEDRGSMVIGAQVLDKRTNQVTNHYATHGVVLASGGLAGIYEHSTNPLGFNALGSSVALALRLEDQLLGDGGGAAGGRASRGGIVSDLEYVQFHPTSLFLPNESRFLLTEALRGEGAILRDGDGRAFARDYHPEGELAPRDIVARAVFCESQKATSNGKGSSPGHNAYLDITHRDGEWLKQRFPSIHHHLMSRSNGNSMDFTKEWMPVIPAAHYTCGGVTTDLSGRVVPHRNLYAAGEAARTGLHGGNRLASTSLLEGLVFGASVGEVVAGYVADTTDMLAMQRRENISESIHRARCAIEQRLVMERRQSNISASSSHSAARTGIPDDNISRDALSILANLKSLMWENVGVVRTPAKLSYAVSELSAICDQADRLWMENGRSAGWEVVALRDASRAGLAVAESALANQVSGGAHYVVLNDEEEDVGRRKAAKGGERKEQDSDEDEDDVLAMARA